MRRQLIVVALVCAIPFALLAAWSRLTPVGAWELELLRALALPPNLVGDLVRTVNLLGDLWIWAIVVLAITAALVAWRRTAAATLVALTLVADFVAFLVKLAVERARPEGVFLEHLLGGESFAFPSGHVVRATTLVAVLAWLAAPARFRLPAALVAGLAAGAVMGYARVALGVHWTSDAAGGLLLGLAWFGLTAAAVEAREQS